MTELTPEQPAERFPPDDPGDARTRIVRSAHALFWDNGINTVGVNRVVADAEVAKTTLYHHFPSKDALAVAVIERHRQTWTHDWLEQEAERRATPSDPGIVALFDALDDWYRSDAYEGCLFTNTVIGEHDRTDPARMAAVEALEDVYALLEHLAEDAGIRDAHTFAHQIHILMRGSIVAAVEGHFEAVAQARELARMLFDQQNRSTPQL